MNLVLIRKAPLHYLQEVLDAAVLYWFPTTNRLSNFDSRSTQLLWSVVHFTVILGFFLVLFLLLALVLLRRFLEGAGRVEGAVKEYEPFVRYKEFDDSSINLKIYFRSKDYTSQFKLKHELMKRIYDRFQKESINIPFPITTVHMQKED